MNWILENWQSVERASAYASVVLPTPGRSSISMWPAAARQMRSRSITSSLPTITRRMFARRRSTVAFASPTRSDWRNSLMRGT